VVEVEDFTVEGVEDSTAAAAADFKVEVTVAAPVATVMVAITATPADVTTAATAADGAGTAGVEDGAIRVTDGDGALASDGRTGEPTRGDMDTDGEHPMVTIIQTRTLALQAIPALMTGTAIRRHRPQIQRRIRSTIHQDLRRRLLRQEL
jgi:type 1 fimbria pilin